jgi:hypothetical protein
VPCRLTMPTIPAEIIGKLILHGGRFAFVCWLH